ncbi:hypothetical protein FRB99_002326 [Tulasnella sp. 403]|nr:hypothetical protein FRB99_002326 [Tulasnella sp. 403]
MRDTNSPAKQVGELNENQSARFTPQGRSKYDTVEFLQFQVQDTLYRLPSSVFKGSLRFQEAMRSACSDAGAQSNDSIVTLTNVTMVEVDNFLQVLTAKHLDTMPIPSFGIKCLLDALRLAALWNFEKVRAFAIKSLKSKLDEVDTSTLLKFAKEAKISQWFPLAYRRLCERANSLTDEESAELGPGPTLAICRVREKHCTSVVYVDCGSCKTCSQRRQTKEPPPDTKARIEDLIALEPALKIFAEASPPDTTSLKLVEFTIENAITASPHTKYCIGDDSFLAVQVEHEPYWLPKALLQTSEFFRPLVGRAQITLGADGTTERQPIKVTGLSAFEMNYFLDLVTASLVDGEASLTFEQIGDALHVATVLEFSRLRSSIIRQTQHRFGQNDPIDFLDVGFHRNVPEYVTSAYARLCNQDEPLSAADGRRLGHERLAAIYRVRHKRTKTDPVVDFGAADTTTKLIQQEPDLDVPAQPDVLSKPSHSEPGWVM